MITFLIVIGGGVGIGLIVLGKIIAKAKDCNATWF